MGVDAQPSNTEQGCPVCGLVVADQGTHENWHIQQADSPQELRRVLAVLGYEVPK